LSENSKIEWTDHTFNPWEGCQKVSPGCDHCYAEARNARFASGTAINWGPGATRRRTSAANWRKPLQWNANHVSFFAEHGRRQRVFCASLADVFDTDVDVTWRRDLCDLIELTPNLNWLLLTKRIGNAFREIARVRSHDWIAGRDNVWLGITVVNQEEAERDIPKLLKTPAQVRFLSVEPMLGPIDIARWLDPTGVQCMDVCPDSSYVDVDSIERADCADEDIPLCPHCGEVASWTGYDDGIDWVIAGGESGPAARPMHPQWARSLRDQCAAARVPFLFKQNGEWVSVSEVAGAGAHHQFEDGSTVRRVGKRAAGRTLDGETHDGFPSVWSTR